MLNEVLFEIEDYLRELLEVDECYKATSFLLVPHL